MDNKKILKNLEKNKLDKFESLNFRILNILLWQKIFNTV